MVTRRFPTMPPVGLDDVEGFAVVESAAVPVGVAALVGPDGAVLAVIEFDAHAEVGDGVE